MKKNLVLEIGVEDLPPYAGDYLYEKFIYLFEDILKEERVDYEILKVYYTPRRIIIYLKNLEEKQRNKTKEVFGPPLEVSIDREKNWTEIAKKFADAHNVSVEKLEIFERKGKRLLE